MGKHFGGKPRYKPRLQPRPRKKIMSEINGEIVEVETKVAYAGRCPVKHVYFKEPLPTNPTMAFASRDNPVFVNIHIEYTKREIVINHKTIGKIHVPIENVKYYIPDSIRNAKKNSE